MQKILIGILRRCRFNCMTMLLKSYVTACFAVLAIRKNKSDRPSSLSANMTLIIPFFAIASVGGYRKGSKGFVRLCFRWSALEWTGDTCHRKYIALS
jgi:hypothetical protein